MILSENRFPPRIMSGAGFSGSCSGLQGTPRMKLLAAAIVLALALATPASAQKLDLSTVSCKQFLESGKENIAFILMWLHGYWTDEDDPPIVDFDKMKT